MYKNFSDTVITRKLFNRKTTLKNTEVYFMVLKSSPAKVRLQRFAQLGYSYVHWWGVLEGGRTNARHRTLDLFYKRLIQDYIFITQIFDINQPHTFLYKGRRLKEKLLKCLSGAYFTAIPFKSYNSLIIQKISLFILNI